MAYQLIGPATPYYYGNRSCRICGNKLKRKYMVRVTSKKWDPRPCSGWEVAFMDRFIELRNHPHKIVTVCYDCAQDRETAAERGREFMLACEYADSLRELGLIERRPKAHEKPFKGGVPR